MQPTLTMRTLPTSEMLVMECDHAVTTGHAVNIVTSDDLQAALGALMARRECSCRPTVMVQEWPSLREAIELHPSEDRKEFDDRVRGQYAAVRHYLVSSQCGGCDPSVSSVISRGSGGQLFSIRHAHECTEHPGKVITATVGPLANQPAS
jgi:hypothetical protein